MNSSVDDFIFVGKLQVGNDKKLKEKKTEKVSISFTSNC
jgi:hypothetical protein